MSTTEDLMKAVVPDSPHPSLDNYLKELLQHYEVGTILHHLADLMTQGVKCHCGCEHHK